MYLIFLQNIHAMVKMCKRHFYCSKLRRLLSFWNCGIKHMLCKAEEPGPSAGQAKSTPYVDFMLTTPVICGPLCTWYYSVMVCSKLFSSLEYKSVSQGLFDKENSLSSLRENLWKELIGNLFLPFSFQSCCQIAKRYIGLLMARVSSFMEMEKCFDMFSTS